MARVIAFANQKGGVAKTTTTLNLGVALAEKGLRVLAVDLDPQGNLTMSQGWNPDEIDRSMFDVLVHKLPITEIVRRNEIEVAVSSIDLAGAELALSAMIGRERALEKALLPVREEYDFILIDSPPGKAMLAFNGLAAADLIIIAASAERMAVDGVADPAPGSLPLPPQEVVDRRSGIALRIEAPEDLRLGVFVEEDFAQDRRRLFVFGRVKLPRVVVDVAALFLLDREEDTPHAARRPGDADGVGLPAVGGGNRRAHLPKPSRPLLGVSLLRFAELPK